MTTKFLINDVNGPKVLEAAGWDVDEAGYLRIYRSRPPIELDDKLMEIGGETIYMAAPGSWSNIQVLDDET